MVLLAAAVSQADDLAVLRNGNSIRHSRREVLGAITRLYLGDSSSGYIEIPTVEIDHFERDTATVPSTNRPPSGQQSSLPTAAPIGKQTLAADPANVSPDRQSLNLMVAGAGHRHQIDPDFINSVIRAESGFNSRAVSKKGAQGLMQLMPQTASQLGVANSFDPNSNVEGGTKYLRALLEKYNYDVPKALAAYNAGARRVDQYRGVPPYNETRAYVASIIRDYNRKKLAENPSLAHKATVQRSKQSSKLNKTTSTSSKPQTIARGPETASR